MDELISVIVPVYNMEDYLARCVESILAQTYQNLEIILVDDGSSDRSPQMCDAYAGRDARIKVIHKANGGLSDARNAGLSQASGAYIGFVDSDDWIEPGMYQMMYGMGRKYQAQVVICRYAEIYGDRVEDGSGNNIVLLSRDEVLDIYICGHPQYKIYNSVWSKLFKREIIGDTRFPVGRNSEDIVFTTKALCRLNRCVYLDTAYYNYVREREGSIMNGACGERMLRDEIPFWREHIEIIRDAGMNELSAKAEYYFYRRLAGYYIALRKAAKKGLEKRRYVRMLLKEIRGDRARIREICGMEFVSVGDRKRLLMIIKTPRLYAFVENSYQKFIIPMKQKNAGLAQDGR